MITRILVEVHLQTCELCGHQWRGEEVSLRCPKCKSPAWNKETRTGAGRPRKDYVARANEEEKARASEPLELETIAVRDIKTDDLELEEESETITVQTIAKDTPVETPKPAKRTKRPVATPKQASKGLRMCRHGFAIVDGITMCKACA